MFLDLTWRICSLQMTLFQKGITVHTENQEFNQQYILPQPCEKSCVSMEQKAHTQNYNKGIKKG